MAVYLVVQEHKTDKESWDIVGVFKNARKADELRASFPRGGDYIYYIFKRELDEEEL